MSQPEWKRTVEALLFAAGEPISLVQIAEAIEGMTPEIAQQLLEELQREYEAERRGFQLVAVQRGYQLVTRPEYAEAVQRLFTKRVSQRLSQAALETLAIVAYYQPVTRAEIEEIRGVSSESALHSLLERRLITVVGRKEVPGRPLLYATTDEFLHHFGLEDLSALPSLAELEEMFARVESERTDRCDWISTWQRPALPPGGRLKT
ncbi:MAG: segregation and condensation protein B [Candidatus Poribacteria bacterium]|nr:MAG: segregation and condensation protein B [Candidatus Poribacteria bacterium]